MSQPHTAAAAFLTPLLLAPQDLRDADAVLHAGMAAVTRLVGPACPVAIYVPVGGGAQMRRACQQGDASDALPDILPGDASDDPSRRLRVCAAGGTDAPRAVIVFADATPEIRAMQADLTVLAGVLSVMLAEREGRRARQILQHAHQQIVLFEPMTLRLLEANAHAQAALGLDPARLGERIFPDLLAGYGAGVLVDLLTPLREGRTQELRIEAILRRDDGTSFPAELLLHLLPGPQPACVAQIVDISARKTVEDRLHAAVDALPDAFVLFDAQDRLVLCNQRYRELYRESAAVIRPGARFEDILRYGLERGQYVAARGREEAWLVDRLAAHAEPRAPIEQDLGDGRWVRVLESVTADGGRVGFRIDISEFKRQQAELEEARAAAEAANAAKTAFLAMISHEIRTPMNGVVGMAELLADSPLTPAQESWVSTILESSGLLVALINDLLDVTKIEAGRLELEIVTFSPRALVDSVAALHRGAARSKDITLTVTVDPSGARARRGDPFRVRQILNNLLSNAVKFTDSGGVTLSLAEDGPDALRFDVADTGIGMSEEQLGRVFEDFVQADCSTTRRYGGTGLGMGISRRLVEAMGGQLDIVSEPRQGTCVTLRLPLPGAPEADMRRDKGGPEILRAPRHAEPLPDLPDLERLRGRHFLVTDDNATNRRVLAAYLNRFGCDVTLAGSGAEAIALYAPGRFDAILMDISMPDMDGQSTLEQLRLRDAAQPGTPVTPALAVTAHALPGLVDGFRAAGFDGHVAKPIRGAMLAGALLDVLPQAGSDL